MPRLRIPGFLRKGKYNPLNRRKQSSLTTPNPVPGEKPLFFTGIKTQKPTMGIERRASRKKGLARSIRQLQAEKVRKERESQKAREREFWKSRQNPWKNELQFRRPARFRR